MDWACTLQTKMETFLKNKKTLPLIVSPDWDGVVSTVLFCEYARRKGIECTVVGTYDCKKIITGESITNAEAALFLDLDLPMDNVCHIGQHLIGHVPLSNSCSFNPNHHYQNTETWTKFPYSTAHLLYYGLFQADERPVSRQAEVALAHCDSSWSNARKYKPNCAAWTQKLEQEKEERIELLRRQIGRRILNQGIIRGWQAWVECAEARSYAMTSGTKRGADGGMRTATRTSGTSSYATASSRAPRRRARRQPQSPSRPRAPSPTRPSAVQPST